jgi:hypothetical protein
MVAQLVDESVALLVEKLVHMKVAMLDSLLVLQLVAAKAV